MSEIINWLRGGSIHIITIVKLDVLGNLSSSAPAAAGKPEISQWVVNSPEEAMQLTRALTETVALKIAEEFIKNRGGSEEPTDHVDLVKRDDLVGKIPDCGMVLDIADAGDNDDVFFRIYVTSFVRRGGEWV
jgi:hypothetical protein